MSEAFPTSMLGELATLTMGQSPDSTSVNSAEAGLPFLQGCAEFGARFPEPRVHCSPPLRVAKSGSNLISVRAPVGTMNHADQDYCIGRGLGAVLAKPGLADDVFLLHAIEANLEFLHRRSQGSTFLAIGSKDLYSLPVPAPSLATQRRIAEILSTMDETIEQTEALIAKMQQVKAGLMHDLFTRGVTPDGHLRPTREQAPELYKESLLGWIPKEWEVASLSDRARIGRSHLKTGPFGSSLKIEHWVEVGHPVITIGALGEGEFIQSELLCVSDVTAQRLRDYQLKAGDVVFSRVADVGRSAVILDDHKGWIMSSNLMRISLDQAKVLAAYLQSQLAYDARLRAQIRATVNSSGREVANSQILNRLLFAWPQPEEQARILDRVKALDDKRKAEVAHLDNLIKQKQGLMHDLLTGRVRVPKIIGNALGTCLLINGEQDHIDG